jgi:EF hand domain-containing protein
MKPSKSDLVAALIAATFLIAPAARAAEAARPDETQFVQLDLDSDGRIALAEWKGGAETFASLDRDGDAVLSRTEFFYQGVRYQTREERFRELDANHDGRLSAAEWKWGEDMLSVLDRDGNGALDRQEFLCRASRATEADSRR